MGRRQPCATRRVGRARCALWLCSVLARRVLRARCARTRARAYDVMPTAMEKLSIDGELIDSYEYTVGYNCHGKLLYS